MALPLNIPAPRKAQKQKVKLKMAIQGPSGSGKTWGALSLARNLWPNAKICVIDTENGSSELYADHFEFDTIPLGPPFHTDRYIACIEAVVKCGYDVCIIDQISHQWDGEGGILRRKEELDQRPGTNSYTNWAKFTPEHQRFKEAIVQAPIHIVATMRAKQDYILETNDRGKQTPRKVGMAAIQREGFDYEFTLLFDVQMDHKAAVNKDRTGLFNEQIIDLASSKVADSLRDWIDRGAAVAPPTTMLPEPAQPQQARTAPRNQNNNDNGNHPPSQAEHLTQFHVEQNRVLCHVYTVKTGMTKQKPQNEYRAVRINGHINNQSLVFCFHKSLFEALDKAENSELQFEYEPSKDGKTISIVDVLSVGGQDYRDGKPYVEPPPVQQETPAQTADATSDSLFPEDAEPALVGATASERKTDSLEITDDDIPF
jgi:hypothetical protein